MVWSGVLDRLSVNFQVSVSVYHLTGFGQKPLDIVVFCTPPYYILYKGRTNMSLFDYLTLGAYRCIM